MVCNLKNGSCSKCGGCCSNILPLTDNEKNKIKKIIKKRKLKPSYHIPLNGFDMTCPMIAIAVVVFMKIDQIYVGFIDAINRLNKAQ